MPNKQIMEIYKIRLSYAVYPKKKWNLVKLLQKTSHFNGHSKFHHQKESKNSEKNSDGRGQVHLPGCLRVEKERSKHNSNLTIRIMIKKKLSSFSLKCLMNAFRTKMNHLSDFTRRTKLSTALCLRKHSGI